VYVCTVGSVYIYGSVSNIWSHQYKLLAVDGATTDAFGRSVSMYGTTAIIGAHLDDDQVVDGGM
jgi:hypothetical protein